MLHRVLVFSLLLSLVIGSQVSPVQARLDIGAKFLTFGIGARASGMGEAFVAVADDPTTIYWNPAGSAFMETKGVTVMHNNLYPHLYSDMYHDVISFIQPLGEKSSLGFGLNYLHSGQQPITNYNPATQEVETVGSAKTSDLAIIGNYARLFSNNLAIGANFKYIYSRLHVFKGKAYAVDLGMLYYTPIEGLKLGANLENWGNKIYFEDDYQADNLPLNLKVGAAYQLTDGILLATDINKPLHHDSINPNIGIEVQPVESLILRAGWFNKDGGLKGKTYGFGLKFGALAFDYANSPAGAFNSTNRVSLTWGF